MYAQSHRKPTCDLSRVLPKCSRMNALQSFYERLYKPPRGIRQTTDSGHVKPNLDLPELPLKFPTRTAPNGPATSGTRRRPPETGQLFSCLVVDTKQVGLCLSCFPSETDRFGPTHCAVDFPRRIVSVKIFDRSFSVLVRGRKDRYGALVVGAPRKSLSQSSRHFPA